MKKPVSIVFNIRMYRDKTFGNTYSKGEVTLVYRDGSTYAHAVPFQYGTAECAARNAKQELQTAKKLPKQSDYEFTSSYYSAHKIACIECFSYVATKKEL